MKVLSKGFALIPFLGEKFKKVNNSKICFPDNSVDILKGMEEKEEGDATAFISRRLMLGKVPVSETIKNNDYDIWNESQYKNDEIP